MLASDLESAARRPWIAAEDESLPHVGAEDVELPVAIEIDEADVRDRRRAGHSGDGQRPPRERSGDSPAGCGQASGAGRRSGARLA